VALALGIDDQIRNDWNPYDLSTPDGLRIEVKSSAYLQSWKQVLSRISFDIKPTYSLVPKTPKQSPEKLRESDVYVFCLLKHQIQETLNPLDLDQWEFFILPTRTLNEKVPKQKSIALSSLLKLKPIKVRYDTLAETISKAG
jgi:hypothetical protein